MGCLDGLQSIFCHDRDPRFADPIVFVEAQQKTPGFNRVDAKDTDDGIHLGYRVALSTADALVVGFMCPMVAEC